jgi:hypothetical protein
LTEVFPRKAVAVSQSRKPEDADEAEDKEGEETMEGEEEKEGEEEVEEGEAQHKKEAEETEAADKTGATTSEELHVADISVEFSRYFHPPRLLALKAALRVVVEGRSSSLEPILFTEAKIPYGAPKDSVIVVAHLILALVAALPDGERIRETLTCVGFSGHVLARVVTEAPMTSEMLTRWFDSQAWVAEVLWLGHVFLFVCIGLSLRRPGGQGLKA